MNKKTIKIPDTIEQRKNIEIIIKSIIQYIPVLQKEIDIDILIETVDSLKEKLESLSKIFNEIK